VALCQRGRREDGGRWARITLAGEDVDDDICRVDALSNRFGTGGLDRRQPVGERRGEYVDHLPIAVVGAGELAPASRITGSLPKPTSPRISQGRSSAAKPSNNSHKRGEECLEVCWLPGATSTASTSRRLASM
jgi:hypothetical protein